MIANIRGEIIRKTADSIVVDLNGLGLRVESAPRIIASLAAPGDEVELYTYLHVRENELTLFGFKLEEEMHLFSLLITVSGIGPKIALQVLEALDPGSFALAILQADVKRLTSAKGIGKKGAERMILELKDKLAKTNMAAGTDPENALNATAYADNNPRYEVISALVVLGYSAQEAETAVNGLELTEDDDVESLLRRALRRLSKW